MTAVVGSAGAVAVWGLWLAVVSWGKVPVRPPASRRGPVSRLVWRRLAVAGGVGLVVLVISRWPVAALAATAGGWVAAGRSRRRVDAEVRTEAIALWAEMLRDSMGASRGVEGVLTATAATAPLAIRGELQRAAERLRREPLGVVLDDLADELDHPLGDLVVTALRLTSTGGGRRLREVLSDLAAAAYAEADAQRRVAVARQRPRSAMRYTAIVIAAFVAGLVAFSPDYLEPYRSALGQLVLAVVIGYWALGLWWMSRMARPATVGRVLGRLAAR